MGERFEPALQFAVVIGRWGDDMALLRTPDGGAVEVAVPEPVREEFDVGDSVEMSADGSVNWRAPVRRHD